MIQVSPSTTMVNRKGKYGRRTGNTLRMGCVARKMNKNYRAEFGIYVGFSGPARVTAEEGEGILDDFSCFVDDGEISQPLCTSQWRRLWQWRDMRFGSYDVFHSMNKHRRWELPALLKDSVSDLERHGDSDYRVQVVERELVTAVTGKNRSKADVISVADSKVAIPQKKSKRQHAYATDLIANTKPRKLGRRERRRLGIYEVEEEHDVIDDLPILKYECCFPRDTQVYPWYNEKQCNQYHCSGKQERPRTKTLKKTKHQRDKKSSYWHGCYSRADFHKLGTFFEGTEDSEAESETEEPFEARRDLPSTGEVLAALLDTTLTDTARRKQPCTERVFGKGCSVPKMASSAPVSLHPKGSAIVCSQIASDITDNDTIEEVDTTTDSHHKDDAEVLEVYEEKPTVQVFLTTGSLKPVELEAVGGAGYQEGQCVPRLLRLDLSDLVKSQVREGGNRTAAFTAQLLLEVGEEISIVDENGQTEECCNTRLSLLTNGEEAVDCDSWGESWESRVAMTVGDVVSQTVGFLSGQLSNRPSQKANQIHKKRKSHSLKIISEICKVKTRSLLPSEAVVSRKKQKEKKQKDTSQNAKRPTACGICWSDICAGDIPSAFALQGCLHWFCRECWENHVVTKVKQGLTDITCPECECSEVVDDTALMVLLPARLYRRYERRVRNVAVDSNDSLHWCRDSKCGRVVSVAFAGEVGDPVPVRCECGSMWCTSCRAEPHWPATCQQAQEHLLELKDRNPLGLLEEATYTAMTKKCPSCNHPMEKNGGCPHMSCICGTSFCWTCGQEYQLHYKNGSFSCPKKPYQLEEIEIDNLQVKNMSLYQQRWYKASLEHRKARGLTRLVQTYKQACKLARRMVLYTDVQLFYRLVEGNHEHTSDNLLSTYMELTEGAADMVMQMHLAAEFTAVLVSNTTRRVKRNSILNLWRKMTFIQDSITRILEEEKPCPSAVQEKLEHLLQAGKGCLRNLHRLTVKKN
ncbi:ARIH1 [Branchiostoma lanceolatum]|uniref:ARIH1 protein n=1 Tax=Branchiostoma lanceolatum TaxID=7740 RepID=A0A8K0EXJ1_BRALA|nr:ARIH1 [Branchiostoma lanceolatum]